MNINTVGYWDEKHRVSDPKKNYNSCHKVLYDTIAAYIGDEDKVLDVGCGAGTLILALGDKRINNYYGIDFSNIAIANLVKTLPELEGRAKVSSCNRLEYLDNEFDVVIICELLEHLDDEVMLETLDEARRVLRSSGRLIISVPNDSEPKHYEHVRAFDTHSLGELVEKKTPDFQISEIGSKWFVLVARS